MKQCHQNYCDDIPEQHRRVHYTRTLAALLQAMANMHEFEHGLMYYNERIKQKSFFDFDKLRSRRLETAFLFISQGS